VPSTPVPRWSSVVFDLDGTLVDTIGLIIESYQHAFRTVMGTEVPEARIRSWIGQPLIRCFREASLEHADSLFDTYSAWNAENTERLAGPYAGVDAMLRDLAAAGVRVAVATSKRLEPTRTALTLCGLDGLVDTLVTMEDTARHKPDPAPLLLALDRLGAPPHDAVYVGDAAVDVRAANAAGMAGIGVLWGAGSREDLEAAGAAAVVVTVEQLRELLLPTPGELPAVPVPAVRDSCVEPAEA
jgi:pyrophosphatase PpaX